MVTRPARQRFSAFGAGPRRMPNSVTTSLGVRRVLSGDLAELIGGGVASSTRRQSEGEADRSP